MEMEILKNYLDYQTKALTVITDELRKENKEVDKFVNQKIARNLISTMTDKIVNKEVLYKDILETIKIKEVLFEELDEKELNSAVKDNEKDLEEILKREEIIEDKDIYALRKMITFAVKGIISYLEEAHDLGYDDAEITTVAQHALSTTIDDDIKLDEQFNILMKMGEFSVRVMQLLDYSREKKSKVDEKIYKHDKLLSIIDEILVGIQSRKIKKLVVISGSDANKEQDEYYEYYREFVRGLPEDTIVFTSGSIKNRLEGDIKGKINGVPRLLNSGDEADFYSIIFFMIKIAQGLNVADLNDIPVAFNIPLRTEKDLLNLLALFIIDFKDMTVGPRLPEYMTANVVMILHEQFNLYQALGIDEDLKRLVEQNNIDVLNAPMGKLVVRYPQLIEVLASIGMHCVGCPSAAVETIEQAAIVHGLEPEYVEKIIREHI